MMNLDSLTKIVLTYLKIVFISNDREEFKLLYDAKIINLKSPRSLENILKFAET